MKVKYKIGKYKKQDNELLGDNERYILFKEISTDRGYSCYGLYRGTYLGCLKLKKDIETRAKRSKEYASSKV